MGLFFFFYPQGQLDCVDEVGSLNRVLAFWSPRAFLHAWVIGPSAVSCVLPYIEGRTTEHSLGFVGLSYSMGSRQCVCEPVWPSGVVLCV